MYFPKSHIFSNFIQLLDHLKQNFCVHRQRKLSYRKKNRPFFVWCILSKSENSSSRLIYQILNLCFEIFSTWYRKSEAKSLDFFTHLCKKIRFYTGIVTWKVKKCLQSNFFRQFSVYRILLLSNQIIYHLRWLFFLWKPNHIYIFLNFRYRWRSPQIQPRLQTFTSVGRWKLCRWRNHQNDDEMLVRRSIRSTRFLSPQSCNQKAQQVSLIVINKPCDIHTNFPLSWKRNKNQAAGA